MNAPNSKNLLNPDVEVKGTIKFAGEMTFAGKLDGDIQSEGALNLGEEAVVKGGINVNSVVVRGKINGNVSAKDKIEIKAKAEMFGDVRAAKLVIEEGVIFVGKCEVHSGKAPSMAAPQPRAGEAAKTAEPAIPARK
jgi:cytoskeletal protein CcmA (bactofilin family)